MSTDTSTGTGARPPPNNLLPAEIRERIPPLYATQDCSDPTVQAKLFTPWTTWTWFVTEFDGQNTCFGHVSGHEVELGYFNLAELEAIEGPGGLRVERDLHFQPQPLSKIRQDLERLRNAPDGFTAHENSDARSATAGGPVTVDHAQDIPSPFDRPGIRLVETKLDTTGLATMFGTVATPNIAASVLHNLIGEADCEHFAALFLNARHGITHAHIVSRGSVQAAPVHPREVFKAAVLANAVAIVVGHNHPSGDVTPSPDDKAVAERLEEAGKLLGIPVLDSLIVGPAGRFYATSIGKARSLPATGDAPRLQEGIGTDELAVICHGLLLDIDEVLERQGEAWWDETVTSGTHHRNVAEKSLGRSPYQPLIDESESPSAPSPE